jgi:aquaporin Z
MIAEAQKMRFKGAGAVVSTMPPSSGAKALRSHWPEYLMEAAELAIFMVSACTFAVLLGNPHSPVYRAIPYQFLRRILMGVAMGLTAISIFYSAWGRQSGAHMNPVVTLTFLRLKKIAWSDALFYIAAQFTGGVVGVLVARTFLRELISDKAVRYAVTTPGQLGATAAFAAELIITFVLFSVVLHSSNSSRWSSRTGLFAGALIALYITFESPISGMSMNPARTFGSAFFAKVFDSIWIYFLAPPIGFLLAAELYVRRRGLHAVLCAKFHHDHSHPCIFRCGYMQERTTETHGS